VRGKEPTLETAGWMVFSIVATGIAFLPYVDWVIK
jgi:hypothetical protein